MINYDIPWNPVRLEQRMGRIHRYGQENDCLIFNFVSTNTREGRVLNKLFDRIRSIEDDLDPKQTGSVFNVLGDVFPANQLERMLREMYARNIDEDVIKDRIVKEVDIERFKQITHSTLEGLAKRELNLSAIVGKAEEAKERRLVPEVVEDFFINASPLNRLDTKEIKKGSHIYRIGKIPRKLWQIGDKLESQFGTLGKEYNKIVFDKKYLKNDPTLEWVTPGHPLFEVIRQSIIENTQQDLQKGAIFYDINRNEPARLDIYSAAIRDGKSNILHRKLFVMQTSISGNISIRQSTIFIGIVPANNSDQIPDDSTLPSKEELEQALIEKALNQLLSEVIKERSKELAIVKNHLEISLRELIHRENLHFANLHERKEKGDTSPGLSQSIKNSEERLDVLNARLENRQAELEQELNMTIADIQHHGRAWILPHPERCSNEIKPMVRDADVERIAIEAVIAYEKSRGWKVQSVEKDDKGFDLISRGPHPEDPQTAVEVRFIEVKGRSGIDQISLTTNEYKTAQRLKDDYWLYAVFNCASQPKIIMIKNPAKLDWEPFIKIEHYFIGSKKILASQNGI